MYSSCSMLVYVSLHKKKNVEEICVPTPGRRDRTARLFRVWEMKMNRARWALGVVRDVFLTHSYIFLWMRSDMCSFTRWYSELIFSCLSNNRPPSLARHRGPGAVNNPLFVPASTNSSSTDASATCSDSRCDRETALIKHTPLVAGPRGLCHYCALHQSWSS